MEYQQILLSLPNLEADRAAAAARIEAHQKRIARETVEAVSDVFESELKKSLAHTFVMVSSQTLAELGVLDKIGRHLIGASLPKRSAHFEAAVTLLAQQHDTVHQRDLYGALFQGNVFYGGSRHDPLSQLPLALEVEDLAFADDDKPRAENQVRFVHLATFKRLHALLGELVQQDKTSPDVISPADNPNELLDAKSFAQRMGATDQTVYNREKAGLIISVLPPKRMRKRGFPSFQLSPRLNQELHQLAIAMYRSHGQDMTFYWHFLRTRHQDLGGSTGVEFLLNRISDPSLLDLEQSERQAIFLALAEEDMLRASA
ncbi:hypothetical protein [Hydrogenophaga sp. 2FB]|uniref:hypothetical protein n=1 Tax=Hydrogenophaga sp. 2FB TaxID=2502187 RepID=UPI0010F54DCE|nr:hypothetical protein [Hydrogenophaga sp. 2FB]